MIDETLLAYIKQQYQLPWDGIHGIDHWTRVWRIGMFLTPLSPRHRAYQEDGMNLEPYLKTYCDIRPQRFQPWCAISKNLCCCLHQCISSNRLEILEQFSPGPDES